VTWQLSVKMAASIVKMAASIVKMAASILKRTQAVISPSAMDLPCSHVVQDRFC